MGSVNLETSMKATFFILATLAFTASAMFTPPKQHPMPKALQFFATLPKILKKDTKADPITDCTKCYNDVLSAIEDCTIDGQDTHEILVCVCDVLGILGGVDASACDPAKLKELFKKAKN